MQNDFITLNRLKFEFRKTILNGHIDTILMPDKDLIILGINNNFKHYNLLISCSSNYPRIHLTNKKYENPKNAFPLCMQLRKLLKGGKILEIELINNDRIFSILIQSESELKESKKYFLIFENMGRFSNIFLLNSENKILNASKPLFYNEDSKRQLFVGSIYTPFRNNKKPINLINNTEIKNVKINDFKNYILENYSGISKKTLNELFEISKNDLNLFFIKNLNKFLEDGISYLQINEKSEPKDILTYKYKTIDNSLQIEQESISKIYDEIFYNIDIQERLNQKTKNFKKKVEKKLEKEQKTFEKNNFFLQSDKEIINNKKFADLIMSNFYKFNKNEEEIKVFDYEKNEEIIIKLDYQKTLKENADAYYKKYSKLKRKKENIEKMQITIEKNIENLNNILNDIKNVKIESDIFDIEEILKENKILESKKENKKNKKVKEYKPNINKYIINDHIVYIGRNSIQNAYITFKLSAPDDIWLHVKNYKSSHAIIKMNKNDEINEEIIEEASKLLLKNSNLEKGIKYSIDYTKKKFVKKCGTSLSNSNVIYKNYKTIYLNY